MVAVIKTGHSIQRIVNYNEQKVKEGVAECIAAVNYPKDVENLSLNNKLNRLLNQASLNENVTRNSVHISLNFDPSEKLSQARLNDIANTYMDKIGFGNQPYLVYQHQDAGHPHIHIVTIKVRENGSRIDTQNIGRNQSEKARKQIEQSFGLKRAEDSKKGQAYHLKAVSAQQVQYGKLETKRAITNVLNAVLGAYKYASLPELNAVLQQYNVLADRGKETSRVYQNNGLTYRITDENGSKIGVPIKASDFYNKPTLKYLQVKFKENETAKEQHKVRVRNTIDLTLLKNSNHSLESFKRALQKEGVHAVLRQNNEGVIYGITYVDHRTKCVFNGSDLGKQYSAKGVQDRCGQSEKTQLVQVSQSQNERQMHERKLAAEIKEQNDRNNQVRTAIPGALNNLLQPTQSNSFVPYQFKKPQKKKRKRISNNL